MGVLGEMFPGPKIKDEAGEAGDGQEWELGPIDLDNQTVAVRRTTPEPPAPEDPDQPS